MVKQPKRAQYVAHLPLSPYPRFPAELASILLLAFLLFVLVAAISQCLCSESPYLSIKLYRIYVCYRNITSYIEHSVLSAVSRNHGRFLNILPVDMEAILYTVIGICHAVMLTGC
jgi:hypothetical protein